MFVFSNRMNYIIYTILSVILISLISILAALPFLLKKKFSQRILLLLMSFSVGTLMGAVVLHLLPEALENGYNINLALFILLGYVVFFVFEKLIHWHHHRISKIKCSESHGHGYQLAPINLVGDALHNLIDGMIIAATYYVSVPLGIVATLSIMLHEIPQEISDFAVLLYSGLNKRKAILFNFISALTAIVGAVIGILMAGNVESFTMFALPFAAGSFVYIAASNLVPELHKDCSMKNSVLHFLAIVAGIGLMILLLLM
ncbi:ZIP family metal transporter [Candidatus Woesearchaeota archaeon]|nr:MAG: ZIP family metal transporter [Candidatus Woesearchaeota archaeon]